MTDKMNFVQIADDLWGDPETGDYRDGKGNQVYPQIGSAVLVERLIERKGMTSSGFARLLDIDSRQVRRWRARKEAPKPAMRRKLVRWWHRMSFVSESGAQSWKAPITSIQLAELRDNPAFQAILDLGRLANQLRFVVSAAIELEMRNDVASFRQRLHACFFTTAILPEGKLLVKRLHKALGHLPKFKSLVALLDCAEIQEFRDARNRVVYHFDHEVVGEGLEKLGLGDTVVVEGDTPETLGVHHYLADLVTLAVVFGNLANNGGDSEDVSKLIESSIHVAVKVASAIDAIAAEALAQFGIAIVVDSSEISVESPDEAS